MILVGQNDSSFVRRVAVTLRHYGMAYQRKPLSVFADYDAVRALHPLGRVPILLLDDGETLADSAAILDHQARSSHHGQARHRVERSPIRQKKAAARSLGYAQGLRRRARPARRDPKGGGSRTTGRVKALARCDSIVARAFPSLSSDIRRAAPVHGKNSGPNQTVGPERALTPASGPERRRVLGLATLATAGCEKSAALVYEREKRPADKVWDDWIARLEGQIAAVLARLDGLDPAPWLAGPAMTQADIGAAVLHRFLGYYHPHLAPDGRYPALDRLAARCEALPAFQAVPFVEG